MPQWQKEGNYHFHFHLIILNYPPMSLFHVFLIVSQAPLTFIADMYSDFVWRTVIEDEEVYDIYVANKYLTYKVLMDYYTNKK